MNNKLFAYHDLKNQLDEFLSLYENRPIKNNTGGMNSSHLFPFYYLLKKINPEVIIESGIWKGLGTWLIEKTCPNSKIISIDPVLSTRQYISNNVKYLTQDFLTMDWSEYVNANTLVFFDDHQDSLPRLLHCKKYNLNKVIFEDNYPPNQGDCYSLKKILEQKKYVKDINSKKEWFNPSEEDFTLLNNLIKNYEEAPPIFKSEFTRWGDLWDKEYKTQLPLLNSSDIEKYDIFYQECKSYTWLCYVELK